MHCEADSKMAVTVKVKLRFNLFFIQPLQSGAAPATADSGVLQQTTPFRQGPFYRKEMFFLVVGKLYLLP